MITQVHIIHNDRVFVVYNVTMKVVMVQRKPTDLPVVFGGWEGLKDLFDSFTQSFSDYTDFNSAIEFFKPVSNINVHGK